MDAGTRGKMQGEFIDFLGKHRGLGEVDEDVLADLIHIANFHWRVMVNLRKSREAEEILKMANLEQLSERMAHWKLINPDG